MGRVFHCAIFLGIVSFCGFYWVSVVRTGRVVCTGRVGRVWRLVFTVRIGNTLLGEGGWRFHCASPALRFYVLERTRRARLATGFHGEDWEYPLG